MVMLVEMTLVEFGAVVQLVSSPPGGLGAS
jgi:hypothetical protein